MAAECGAHTASFEKSSSFAGNFPSGRHLTHTPLLCLWHCFCSEQQIYYTKPSYKMEVFSKKNSFFPIFVYNKYKG